MLLPNPRETLMKLNPLDTELKLKPKLLNTKLNKKFLPLENQHKKPISILRKSELNKREKLKDLLLKKLPSGNLMKENMELTEQSTLKLMNKMPPELQQKKLKRQLLMKLTKRRELRLKSSKSRLPLPMSLKLKLLPRRSSLNKKLLKPKRRLSRRKKLRLTKRLLLKDQMPLLLPSQNFSKPTNKLKLKPPRNKRKSEVKKLRPLLKSKLRLRSKRPLLLKRQKR
jgi:hypothetical protein